MAPNCPHHKQRSSSKAQNCIPGVMFLLFSSIPNHLMYSNSPQPHSHISATTACTYMTSLHTNHHHFTCIQMPSDGLSSHIRAQLGAQYPQLLTSPHPYNCIHICVSSTQKLSHTQCCCIVPVLLGEAYQKSCGQQAAASLHYMLRCNSHHRLSSAPWTEHSYQWKSKHKN